jgi:hypothetical protein
MNIMNAKVFRRIRFVPFGIGHRFSDVAVIAMDGTKQMLL